MNCLIYNYTYFKIFSKYRNLKIASNNRLYEINYAIYKSIISITNNYFTRLRLNYIFRFDKIVEQEKGFYLNNTNKESIDIIVDDILKTEIDRLNNLAQRLVFY